LGKRSFLRKLRKKSVVAVFLYRAAQFVKYWDFIFDRPFVYI